MLKEHKKRNDEIKKNCLVIGLKLSDKEIDFFNGGEAVCSYCNEPVMIDDKNHSCAPALFKRIAALEKLVKEMGDKWWLDLNLQVRKQVGFIWWQR